MYRFICLFLASSFLLASCNKDDGDSTPQEQEIDAGFFALQVGNSWVYNYFWVDSDTGELTNAGGIETVDITVEEVIAGETIFTMKTTTVDNDDTCGICNQDPLVITKVKDSVGFLVEVGGPLLFSSVSRQDFLVYRREFGDVHRVLKENEVLITVPAGQFYVSG